MTARSIEAEADAAKEQLVHEILGRVADKWSLLVIDALEGQAETRFGQLAARVPGISQKMLTKTLRQLERDGLVARRVHAAVPPRVDYRLTPLGASLGEAVCGVWLWVEAHHAEVEQARLAFEARAGLTAATTS